jgi:hypothetical protein
MRTYLIDETPFIRAGGSTRDDLVDRLERFLSLSKKKAKDRKFKLLMPHISGKRLGTEPLNLARCFLRMKVGFGSLDAETRLIFTKRFKRAFQARRIIARYLRRSLILRLHKQELLDLFSYMNEMKSLDLKKNRDIKMLSDEVIPLETCLVAQIAHRHRLHLLSFNTDFRYAKDFRHQPDYIRFQSMTDFLMTDFPNLQ